MAEIALRADSTQHPGHWGTNKPERRGIFFNPRYTASITEYRLLVHCDYAFVVRPGGYEAINLNVLQ